MSMVIVGADISDKPVETSGKVQYLISPLQSEGCMSEQDGSQGKFSNQQDYSLVKNLKALLYTGYRGGHHLRL